MPTPPPRKRFQIHLSTAIVMMFVAGGLVWANVQESVTTERYEYMKQIGIFPAEYRKDICGEKYGWPVLAVAPKGYLIPAPDSIPPVKLDPVNTEIQLAGAGINLFVAFAILLTVYFLCEWLIRRRAARKDA